MKSTRDVGMFVVVAALLWACLPKPSYETTWESLKAHTYLTGHLLGWLPAARPRTRFTSEGMPRGSPGMRPANGSIPEVQGFVDLETFKEKYMSVGPAVFRNAATKQHGFNLECLTGTGRPLQEELERQMGNKRVRIFKDYYNDGSAAYMNMSEYGKIAEIARNNISAPMPYPRAFPQMALGDCLPVPEKKLEQYHGMFSTAAMLPEGQKALVFLSMNKGTTTKMHMDLGDSLFTQVVGRKKWIFADSSDATVLKVYGENKNLFFSTGYDVHHEPVPVEVRMKEVILNPGDIVYFPSMTFHAVSNIDEVTMGIDQPAMDFYGSFKRHWLCTICSVLNPKMIFTVIKQFLQTGSINGHEVYFDEDTFSAKVK